MSRRKEPGWLGLTRVINDVRQRARKRRHPVELTRDEFRRITSSDCHYCGAPPSQIQTYGRTAEAKANATYVYNGVDRIDSSKGYVTSNVVPCCGTCNKMKLALTVDQFLDHVKQIARHMEKKQ